MRMVLESPATPLSPISILSLPTVILMPASLPNARLPRPVVLKSALKPQAVLPKPMVLLSSASKPVAVLPMPVVL
jgi:hypothetical protein